MVPASWPRLGPGLSTGARLLLAWAVLDGAIAVYLLGYGTSAISGILLAAGLAIFGFAAMPGVRTGALVVTAGLIIVVAQLAFAAIGPYRSEGGPVPDAYRLIPLFGLAAMAVGEIVRRTLPGRFESRRGALWLVIGAGLAYRIVIVATDVPPTFDVAAIQAAAGQAVLHLSDPYLTLVYRFGYPYLPIAAAAAALGEIAGDARWMSCVGDLGTLVGILLFARRIGADDRLAVALAAAWAWWAGAFFVTWQGFPEPVLVGLMTLGAAAMAGPAPRRVLGGLLVGLAIATKQFGFGLVPFAPWGSRSWARFLSTGAAVVLAILAPFAMWHPAEFADGAFLSLLREPGRDYALNLLDWPGATFDLPLVLVFPLALAFGWLCRRRQPTPMTAWLGGSAGLLLLATAFNRIAFINYYAIPLVLVLLLILAIDGWARTGEAA